MIQAFDAHAGAQRMAARLVKGLRTRGAVVELWLGFGRSGFVGEAGPSWRFLPLETPLFRKLLWPLWLAAACVVSLVPLTSGRILWANSIAAMPAGILYLLFAPRRVILHVHENRLPGAVHRFIAWAGRRGATVLTVSAHHQRMLGLPSAVLPNAVGDGPPPDPPALRERLVFVGTTSAMKGWPLFLDIVQRLGTDGLKPWAFLAAAPYPPEPRELARAQSLGIGVSIGETRPAVHLMNAFLALQLTDPALADETFSLVAAEAVWHLVPVGGAGAAVLPEVAGDALAFNIESRDPQAIADAIAALWADPLRHASLVAACRAERMRFGWSAFMAGVAAIVEPIRAS